MLECCGGRLDVLELVLVLTGLPILICIKHNGDDEPEEYLKANIDELEMNSKY